MQRWLASLLVVAVVPFAFACSGSDEPTSPADVVDDGEVGADVSGDTAVEVGPEVVGEPGVETGPEATEDVEVSTDVPDAAEGLEPELPPDGVEPDATDVTEVTDLPVELPPLALQAPLVAPADPLKDTGIESCPVYQDQRCEAG